MISNTAPDTPIISARAGIQEIVLDSPVRGIHGVLNFAKR